MIEKLSNHIILSVVALIAFIVGWITLFHYIIPSNDWSAFWHTQICQLVLNSGRRVTTPASIQFCVKDFNGTIIFFGVFLLIFVVVSIIWFIVRKQYRKTFK